MPKYKQIKSVAHNFSHSFTSMMNWEERIYVMDRLISVMSKNSIDEITLDIIHAHLNPEITNTKEILVSVDHYCNIFFPRLLESHGLSSDYIKSAGMTLRFNFTGIKPQQGSDNTMLVPFKCQTIITDDKNRTHIGEVNDLEATHSKFIFAG